jgi:hypothetical protein
MTSTTDQGAEMATKTRDWRTARKPVRLDELTPDMLAPARKAADKSWLPQTVWPSQWFGRQFVGVDCLLVNAAAPFIGPGGIERPAEDSAPLLTVLPAHYYDR